MSPQLRAIELLSVGRTVIDQVATDTPIISGVDLRCETFLGGAATNVAVGAARLGTPSGLIAAIGDDEWGQFIRAELARYNVDQRGIQTVPAASTFSVTIVPQPGGKTSVIPPVNRERYADRALSAESIPAELFADVLVTVIQSSQLNTPCTKQAIERAIEITKRTGGIIVMDANIRPSEWPDGLEVALEAMRAILAQVDVLKCNQEEALKLSKGDAADASSLVAVFPQLTLALVTDESRGTTWCSRGVGSGSVAAISVEQVDPTGAGDAFLAGFLHQICTIGFKETISSAHALELAITFANCCGAIAVTKLGALNNPPTEADVHSFLSARGLQ